jgi:hypothetical protein
MSATSFEAFLARLYADAAARARFMADPMREARAAGLNDEECRALIEIDRVGLELAGRSFDAKRRRTRKTSDLRSWLRRIM